LQIQVLNASTSASVRRSMSCIQEQPTEGSASKCQGKWPLASVLQEGRENANIDAGFGIHLENLGLKQDLVSDGDSRGESIMAFTVNLNCPGTRDNRVIIKTDLDLNTGGLNNLSNSGTCRLFVGALDAAGTVLLDIAIEPGDFNRTYLKIADCCRS